MNDLDWTIPNWLDDAIDLNILVYDSQSNGAITTRLLHLLKQAYKKNLKDEPQRFYLPNDRYLSINEGLTKIIHPTHVYGCELVWIDMEPINEYFLSQNCTFFGTRDCLVICEGKYHMLGCL